MLAREMRSLLLGEAARPALPAADRAAAGTDEVNRNITGVSNAAQDVSGASGAGRFCWWVESEARLSIWATICDRAAQRSDRRGLQGDPAARRADPRTASLHRRSGPSRISKRSAKSQNGPGRKSSSPTMFKAS